MSHPNICPCITIDLPPTALDILIEVLADHIAHWDLGAPDDDPDLKMRVTMLQLLREYRTDFKRRVNAGEVM